jgi:hypothetical protein
MEAISVRERKMSPLMPTARRIQIWATSGCHHGLGLSCSDSHVRSRPERCPSSTCGVDQQLKFRLCYVCVLCVRVICCVVCCFVVCVCVL